MKTALFGFLFLLASYDAFATCATKEVLDEEAGYESCEITVDGTTTNEKISESACAAHCQLLAAKNKMDTLQEFKKLKKITVKPGEAKK